MWVVAACRRAGRFLLEFERSPPQGQGFIATWCIFLCSTCNAQSWHNENLLQTKPRGVVTGEVQACICFTWPKVTAPGLASASLFSTNSSEPTYPLEPANIAREKLEPSLSQATWERAIFGILTCRASLDLRSLNRSTRRQYVPQRSKATCPAQKRQGSHDAWLPMRPCRPSQ